MAAFLNSTPQGPHKFATILSQQAKRWTAMNGERYSGESLPFEPSMRHADGRRMQSLNIQRIDVSHRCISGRTKPKCSIFSMHGGLPAKSGTRSNGGLHNLGKPAILSRAITSTRMSTSWRFGSAARGSRRRFASSTFEPRRCSPRCRSPEASWPGSRWSSRCSHTSSCARWARAGVSRGQGRWVGAGR